MIHVNSLNEVAEIFKSRPEAYLNITDKSNTEAVRRQLVKKWGMDCYKGERLHITGKHSTGGYFNVFVMHNKNKFIKT